MKRALFPLALALAAVVAGCGGDDSGSARTVNWYVFKEPSGAFDKAASYCTQQSNGSYKIKIQALPTDADQQRELVVRRLAAKDSSIDIIGMDVNWTAEFAEANWIQPWKGADKKAVTDGTIPALLQSAQYKGQLYGATYNSNTQLLWYRKDLVPNPPTTWDELFQQAQKLGKLGKIEEQGAKYEGLVVWFNTLYRSAGADDIVDQNGNLHVDPAAAKAAAQVMKTLGTKFADPGLGNAKEDQARLGFENGKAAFQINYPYIYASAKTDKPAFAKKIGWTQVPQVIAGKPSHVTIGGINLGISKYTKHANLAFKAATCLRSAHNQVIASQLGGLPPTLAALYDNAEVKKALPMADALKKSLETGVPRPVTPAYADISLGIQDTIHPVSGIDPDKIAKALKDNLNKVKKGGLI